MITKQHIATRLKCYSENIRDMAHFKGANLDDRDTFHLKALRATGYTVIENFFTDAECHELIKEIDSIIEKYQGQIWIDDHHSDHRIFGAESVSVKIKEFYANERLRLIGEAYLRTKLDNYMTLGAKLEAKEENLGSGGGWHRDSTYEHQFKSIVYLTDVEETNGPFQFVTGSHKTENVIKTVGLGKNNNRYTHKEVSQFVSNNNFEIQTFNARRGSVILVDTKGLHRGKPIQVGERYALTNYYIGSYKRAQFEGYFSDLTLKA